tara:strand:- start:2489 stop:2998 length:510 start_codon:yes stop_codon:yes gene_type:complete
MVEKKNTNIERFLREEVKVEEIKELINSLKLEKLNILNFIYELVSAYEDKSKENSIENALNISISASKKGFDWPDYASCFNKVEEEVKELKMAIENKDSDNIKEEYGDLLLALINFARLKELDIFASIDLATLKFEKRFTKLRTLAKKRKINLKNATDLVKKGLWNDSK